MLSEILAQDLKEMTYRILRLRIINQNKLQEDFLLDITQINQIRATWGQVISIQMPERVETQ